MSTWRGRGHQAQNLPRTFSPSRLGRDEAYIPDHMRGPEYDRYFAHEWMGTPQDAPPGAARNTHRHDFDIPVGTVNGRTPRW